MEEWENYTYDQRTVYWVLEPNGCTWTSTDPVFDEAHMTLWMAHHGWNQAIDLIGRTQKELEVDETLLKHIAHRLAKCAWMYTHLISLQEKERARGKATGPPGTPVNALTASYEQQREDAWALCALYTGIAIFYTKKIPLFETKKDITLFDALWTEDTAHDLELPMKLLGWAAQHLKGPRGWIHALWATVQLIQKKSTDEGGVPWTTLWEALRHTSKQVGHLKETDPLYKHWLHQAWTRIERLKGTIFTLHGTTPETPIMKTLHPKGVYPYSGPPTKQKEATHTGPPPLTFL